MRQPNNIGMTSSTNNLNPDAAADRRAKLQKYQEQ